VQKIVHDEMQPGDGNDMLVNIFLRFRLYMESERYHQLMQKRVDLENSPEGRRLRKEVRDVLKVVKKRVEVGRRSVHIDNEHLDELNDELHDFENA